MKPKDIKIVIPKGYEIDTEKSTFERIVFKKKTIINSWEDLEKVKGCYIDTYSSISEVDISQNCEENKNVFLNEKYAKSALALAQISQLLPYYDTNVNWEDGATFKHCIYRQKERIVINTLNLAFEVLAFNTREEADRFLKYNEQLVKDYFML